LVLGDAPRSTQSDPRIFLHRFFAVTVNLDRVHEAHVPNHMPAGYHKTADSHTSASCQKALGCHTAYSIEF
jgi:hypothetical protein